MDDPGSPTLLLSPDSPVRIEVTPVTLSGQARQQPEVRTFPFALHSPAVVSLYFNRAGRVFPIDHAFLIVRATAGTELALVRLR